MNCQNCGQDNDFGANFCRFCGTRIVLNQQTNQSYQDSNNYTSPRPYAWKTDEFQVSNHQQTQQMQQVQPNANETRPLYPNQQPIIYQQQNTYQPPANLTYQPPQPLFQQQQYVVPAGYRCPRCGSQNAPQFVRKISAAGWIVFAVLLVMFFPLFWIGLLIKEDVRVCPICTLKVG
jgi:hypothetical protein